MMRAALGMSALAMLRVASVESPAWTWGSMDTGEAAMARPPPTVTPAADAHGITLQVAAISDECMDPAFNAQQDVCTLVPQNVK
jgi:hypothetical protein